MPFQMAHVSECVSGLRNPITHSSMCFLDRTGIFRECSCPLSSCEKSAAGDFECVWTDLTYVLLFAVFVPWVYYFIALIRALVLSLSAVHRADDQQPLCPRPLTDDFEDFGTFT